MNKRSVDQPLVRPGEILLEEFLKPLGLSQSRLALSIRVPVRRINAIVRGQCGISADTAVRFARYFKNSPDFWMNLQMHYELSSVDRDRIEMEVLVPA